MGITERKSRKQEEIKQQIIKESYAIICNEGWQALSIRKIADAIEYSVPVIYKHFENKEAIIEYFTLEGFRLLTQHMQRCTSAELAPCAQLRILADSYWDFAHVYPAYYRIMFGLGIPACETINSSLEISTMSKFMYDAIEATALNAGNKALDLHLKLKTLWSMLHGFVAIELLSNNNLHKEPSPMVRDAVDGFIFTLIHKK